MIAVLSDNGALPDPLGLLHRHFNSFTGAVEGTHLVSGEVEGEMASDIGQPPDVVDARDHPHIGTVQTEMSTLR